MVRVGNVRVRYALVEVCGHLVRLLYRLLCRMKSI